MYSISAYFLRFSHEHSVTYITLLVGGISADSYVTVGTVFSWFIVYNTLPVCDLDNY